LDRTCVCRRSCFQWQQAAERLRVTLKENTKSIAVNGKREQLTDTWAIAGVFPLRGFSFEVAGNAGSAPSFHRRGVASLRPAYVRTVSITTRHQTEERILRTTGTRPRLLELQNLLAP